MILIAVLTYKIRIRIRKIVISPNSCLEFLQELERLLLQRDGAAVPLLLVVPRVEVLLEGHEVEDGLLDDVAHVDGGGHVPSVHYLSHQEDSQLLGALRVVIPAQLSQCVLVVTDQSPDDGMSYPVIFQ